jgi:hypothetical protein
MAAPWRSVINPLQISITVPVLSDLIMQIKLQRYISTFLFVKQVMITQQRKDLQMNIPALRKLDMMLLVIIIITIHNLLRAIIFY